MNKTIIININGTIFHIEEEAYEVLQEYMVEVKKHFGYSSDSQEIVADIENRIAEMFSDRIKPSKAVINMQDVEEVCAQMGSIRDFEESTEPASEDIYSQNKSLYRDPEDKWLGGVCSGLAHYFNIESIWIRFGFAALFLFAGTGLLVYILLWVLVPLARTRTEKMQMRGERQNLQNFKRSFDEEMEGIRKNFSAAGERVGPGLKTAAKHTENALSAIARLLIKIVGIVLIITCGFAIIAALTATLALLGVVGPDSWKNLEVAHFLEPQYYGPMIICSFLLAAIPCFLLIILSLRLFLDFKFSKYLGFTMLTLWLIALFSVIYFSTAIAMDFREDATYTEKDSIETRPVYYLDVNNSRSFQKVNGKYSSFFNPKLNRSFNDLSTSVRIFPLKKGTSPYVIKKFEANGGTFNIALERAQNIAYDITQQDSLIIFNSHSFIKKGLIRGQNVQVELYLPEGSLVQISSDNRYFFRGIDFSTCLNAKDDRPGTQTLGFIMGSSGLICMEEPNIGSDLNLETDSTALTPSEQLK